MRRGMRAITFALACSEQNRARHSAAVVLFIFIATCLATSSHGDDERQAAPAPGPATLRVVPDQPAIDVPDPPSSVTAQGQLPTSVTIPITIVPSATERVVDDIFARRGISADARLQVQADLQNLRDEDLAALTRGVDPLLFDLDQPSDATTEVWKQLVQAYAQVGLESRKARGEKIWNVVSNLFFLLFGALVGIAVDRWRTRTRNFAQHAPR
jgi:hypothetical protein